MRFSKAIRQASNTLAVASVAFMAAATAPAQSLNWDGQTGIYVTPLAYVSGSPAGKAGKPSVGYHFLNGGSVLGNWSSISVTEGLAGRMEVGYTRTMMSAGSDKALSPLWDGGFNVVHAKGVLVTENLNKHNWVPAISAGFVARMGDKNVSGVAGGNKSYTNADFYLVGTKIVTQTKKLPLLLNFGVKGSNASVLGLTGNAPDYKARIFGGAGFVLTGPGKSTIILATEFTQQPKEIKNVPGVVIPTTIAYAARIVPKEKTKLNIDLGIAQVAGKIAPGVDVQLRHQFVAAVSYAF